MWLNNEYDHGVREKRCRNKSYKKYRDFRLGSDQGKGVWSYDHVRVKY